MCNLHRSPAQSMSSSLAFLSVSTETSMWPCVLAPVFGSIFISCTGAIREAYACSACNFCSKRAQGLLEGVPSHRSSIVSPAHKRIMTIIIVD